MTRFDAVPPPHEPLAPWVVLAATVLLAPLVACDDDPEIPPPIYTVDLDADSDRDGLTGEHGDEDALEMEWPGAVVPVNLDDDNEDLWPDHEVDAGAVDDDRTPVVLRLGGGPLPCGARTVLTLSGDVELWRVRVGEVVVLGQDGDGAVVEAVGPAEPELDLTVEALAFNATVTLGAELLDGDGASIGVDEVLLSSPPMLLSNHLDPAEELHVVPVDATAYGDGNAAMIAGIVEAIGAENVVLVPPELSWSDIWVQDELEFVYQPSTAPMSMVLDSIRDRGLDFYPELGLWGPDFGWLEIPGDAPVSLDSFGNLDCTPPLTADGTAYPFGRIYYGGKPGEWQMDAALRAFLDEQGLQAPVELDSTWLLVGHVDEMMTFVPDASSAKGFKMLFADTMAALEILEGLDPEMAIPRYEASYGLATVGDLLDSAIPDYNEDLDALHLQPVRAQAMEAFGLTEEDVLGVPSLYEPMEKGWALALVPGMVNLQVFDEHLLIADPFFRGEDDGQDADPFIAAMEALLPEGVTPHFLDDWSSYHLLYGEVHCGTNVVRTPRTAPGWWEVE